MPLQFYEKVEVLSCPLSPDRVGKFGHVLGKSFADDDPASDQIVGYAVFFDDVGQVYSFSMDDLKGTGDIASRSKFYHE